MKVKFGLFLAILFFPFFAFGEELIVYRPQNTQNINLVRCWIKIQDEDGNDVTQTVARASYAYMDRPNVRFWYQKSFYLDGGMACHLYLNRGKYKISVFTPKNQVEGFPIAKRLQTDWDSTVFEYDSSKIENSVDKNANILHVIGFTFRAGTSTTKPRLFCATANHVLQSLKCRFAFFDLISVAFFEENHAKNYDKKRASFRGDSRKPNSV